MEGKIVEVVNKLKRKLLLSFHTYIVYMICILFMCFL